MIIPILKDVSVKVIDFTEYLDMSLELKQPGIHNRLNAAAALAVAKYEKLPLEEAKSVLKDFAGTWRRFQFKGHCNGALVYDDYAHHPTAVAVTLQGAREAYPHKRIIAVFEPHTYSRTKVLFKQFAKSFAAADEILIVPIYAAREENVSGVTSRELAVEAIQYAPNTRYVESLELAATELKASATSNDVIIIMGAGTVTKLADELVK
jgi:UDP-N-acetylmuramate--alanine ligase